MRTVSKWAKVGVLAVCLGALPSHSFACACCAEMGDRFAEQVELDDYDREILTSISFARTADVSIGPRAYEDLEGITIRALPLIMDVEKTEDQWTFAFDDGRGSTGHLVFELPKRFTKFEVDPHDPSETESLGGGPLLYKEWKLTSEAEGDGMLSESVGGDQRATLILHGRGNHCPSIDDFNAWSIVLHGSQALVTLFGDLEHQSSG